MSYTDDADFLGKGWTFPPTFDLLARSVVISRDLENIRQCLTVLMGTALGERLMLPTYGSQLDEKVFRALSTTLANQIRALVEQAILDWEPRIATQAVEVRQVDATAGLLEIVVEFLVRQTNVRSNFVYPFYLLEATLSPPSP
ncbi:GPW/gp25 family protein [Niveispirillum sp. KHB5.9]|uniref:GPW/gp25 family protein n=1 Tax=Niveispirillum sp. KHB5.9 TaxID=3400269 RepID=UPI003A85B861